MSVYTNNPCKFCIPPLRNPTCHDNCIEYLEWKAEYNKVKQNRLDEIRERSPLYTAIRDADKARMRPKRKGVDIS